MKTKRLFIGEYIDKSPKERIYQLLDYYKDFAKYREGYKESVVNLMLAMREYNDIQYSVIPDLESGSLLEMK